MDNSLGDPWDRRRLDDAPVSCRSVIGISARVKPSRERPRPLPSGELFEILLRGTNLITSSRSVLIIKS